jgi:anti-sigma factor ChrR (cupin superfamily)
MEQERTQTSEAPVGARSEPTPGQTLIVKVADLPWRTLANGAKMKVLYHDAESGAMTALFKFEPGMSTPLHEHTGVEQTFVLEGALVDDDGAVTAGNFVVRQAGSVHQARAPAGSLHLAFFSKPNRTLEGKPDAAFPHGTDLGEPGAGGTPRPAPNQSSFVKVTDMPWQQSKTPGIMMKPLYRDESVGASTFLIKFAAGAKTPLHEHTGLEQTFVLEGGLVDHDGAITAGNFVWRKAGSVHQATAPNGSLHLAVFAKPNRMLDGSEDDLAAPR